MDIKDSCFLLSIIYEGTARFRGGNSSFDAMGLALFALMSKNAIYEKIGKRVKEAREKSGMTQAALAENVGVSVTYIYSIERGISFPRGEVLVGILNALNVSDGLVFCDVASASLKQKSCLL